MSLPPWAAGRHAAPMVRSIDDVPFAIRRAVPPVAPVPAGANSAESRLAAGPRPRREPVHPPGTSRPPFPGSASRFGRDLAVPDQAQPPPTSVEPPPRTSAPSALENVARLRALELADAERRREEQRERTAMEERRRREAETALEIRRRERIDAEAEATRLMLLSLEQAEITPQERERRARREHEAELARLREMELQKHLSSITEWPWTCQVCMASPAYYCIVQCGHFCLCRACAEQDYMGQEGGGTWDEYPRRSPDDSEPDDSENIRSEMPTAVPGSPATATATANNHHVDSSAVFVPHSGCRRDRKCPVCAGSIQALLRVFIPGGCLGAAPEK